MSQSTRVCDRGPACQFWPCPACGDPDLCATHGVCGTCGHRLWPVALAMEQQASRRRTISALEDLLQMVVTVGPDSYAALDDRVRRLERARDLLAELKAADK